MFSILKLLYYKNVFISKYSQVIYYTRMNNIALLTIRTHAWDLMTTLISSKNKAWKSKRSITSHKTNRLVSTGNLAPSLSPPDLQQLTLRNVSIIQHLIEIVKVYFIPLVNSRPIWNKYDCTRKLSSINWQVLSIVRY